MFPEDRSWMVSFLWDDDWACIGGSDDLIGDLESDPALAPNGRRAGREHDATPPGDWPGWGSLDPASRLAGSLIGGSDAYSLQTAGFTRDGARHRPSWTTL